MKIDKQVRKLVIKQANKYIILQIVEGGTSKNKVICSANTKELLKLGWSRNENLTSVKAAYFGGLLLGKKTKLNRNVVVDKDLISNVDNSIINAAVKGVHEFVIKEKPKKVKKKARKEKQKIKKKKHAV